LAHANAPAVIYALQMEFCQQALAAHQADRYIPRWVERRSSHPDNLPDTPFKTKLLTMTAILDEIAFIDTCLLLLPPDQTEIAGLIDWYVEHKLYDLEYAYARASSQLLYLPVEHLRPGFETYLAQAKQKIKAFLDRLDHVLADAITTNWSGYLSHPRLAINIL
jgi:hypothetical protein